MDKLSCKVNNRDKPAQTSLVLDTGDLRNRQLLDNGLAKIFIIKPFF